MVLFSIIKYHVFYTMSNIIYNVVKIIDYNAHMALKKQVPLGACSRVSKKSFNIICGQVGLCPRSPHLAVLRSFESVRNKQNR